MEFKYRFLSRMHKVFGSYRKLSQASGVSVNSLLKIGRGIPVHPAKLKAVKNALNLSGGAGAARVLKGAKKIPKPQTPAKEPSRPDAVLASLGLLLAGINRVAASLDHMGRILDPDLTLVPSVEAQKAQNRALSKRMGRRPLPKVEPLFPANVNGAFHGGPIPGGVAVHAEMPEPAHDAVLAGPKEY